MLSRRAQAVGLVSMRTLPPLTLAPLVLRVLFLLQLHAIAQSAAVGPLPLLVPALAQSLALPVSIRMLPLLESVPLVLPVQSPRLLVHPAVLSAPPALIRLVLLA